MTQRQASSRGARDYSDVPVPTRPRSRFDRSHTVHTAFNAGDLIPVDREEMLPGDTIQLKPTIFARLTTLVVPVFSNVYFDLHYFFVPLRLIWENAGEFFGAEPGGPGTRVDRLTPKLDCSTAIVAESLQDYLGIPPGFQALAGRAEPHNFYGRAYNLIWNEWYRDAELQDLVTVDRDDSDDDPADYVILKRNKQRDRFTSARPWPYKGPDVAIDLGDNVPVVASPTDDRFMLFANSTEQYVHYDNGTTNLQLGGQTATGDVHWGSQTGLEADLASGSGASVINIRSAFALQQMFEQFARGGSARYVELLENLYGVKSPDARQQRPEFIGSTTARIMVNTVASTAAAVNDIGDLGAYAVGMKTGGGMSYSAVEHGVVLGIASIRTEYLYSQGLDKDLMRDTRFDYHQPHFEAVGEQPILNRELYLTASGTGDTDVWGYEPRHQEYRERLNSVTGKMRPSHPQTLAVFHLGQLFASQPLLNEAFIQEAPPFDRVTQIASAVEPSFKVDLFIDETMIRPVAAVGQPGMRVL